MDNAFAFARRIYSEELLAQLVKGGNLDELLELTRGKPRGQVQFNVTSFFAELAPEGSAASAMLWCSFRFLFDEEAVLNALEAAPWGDDP